MPGSILTFYRAMTSSSFLSPTAFPDLRHFFGEEFLENQQPPPSIVWFPSSTVWLGGTGGYAGDGLNSPRTIDRAIESWEIHLRAIDSDPQAPPEKHADALQSLRQAVIQALMAQRWTGLFYKVARGAWKRGDGAQNRLGRGYVLFVDLFDGATMPPDAEAKVTTMPTTTAEQHPDGTLVLNV